MKLFSISIVLFTYLIILIFFVSNANSEKSELEIYKDVFNNGVLKQIGEYLNETNQFDKTSCAKDIGIWYAALISVKQLWPFQSM